MSETENWQTIEVGAALSFRVPADASEREVQPVDSIVGIIDGHGYQLTYDFGRFSEQLEDYRESPGFAMVERRISGRRAREATFEDRDSPELPWTRLLRVEDGAQAFTLRLSCADPETLAMGDAIFASVTFH